MVTRDNILDAAQQLTTSTGRLPSILDIARSVGLTKQGVLHHFPTRAALDVAVTRRALSRVDAEMSAAAADGSPVETYVRLSSPSDADEAVFLALLAASRAGDTGLAAEIEQAVTRWQAMIAEEVGDPTHAEVVRLVGDGLFGEALLTGVPPDPDRLTRIVAHLRGLSPKRQP